MTLNTEKIKKQIKLWQVRSKQCRKNERKSRASKNIGATICYGSMADAYETCIYELKQAMPRS